MADCSAGGTCHVEGAKWCYCWEDEDGGCGCRWEFETVKASAGAGTGVQEKGSMGKNRLGLDSKISFWSFSNNAPLLDVANLLDEGIRDNGILVPVKRTGEKIYLDIKQKTLKELVDSLGLVLANSP